MHKEVGRIRGAMSGGKRYPELLESVTIRNLRGFSSTVATTIGFPFPVTAIVGENGAGKTTALKAAACAYEQAGSGRSSYQPGKFFMSTAWDTVRDVEIQCNIKRNGQTQSVSIRKPSDRWRISGHRPARHLFLMDVSRVMPLDALMGYAQVAKRTNREAASQDLSKESRDALGYALNRDFVAARFASTNTSTHKVGILAQGFGDYSAFHQGAGEAASLQLFWSLESMPDNSLLLIDEIDASLHPKAQRRIVHSLLTLSRRKGIQVIMTTHSPYVLEELPDEARVLLQRASDGVNVVYGATPQFCMSSIDDKQHPDLTIFCEDRRAETLIRALIDPGEDRVNAEIFAVGSWTVVQQLARLGQDGKLPYRCRGVVDGSINKESCVSLPGDSEPEVVVFHGLRDKSWPDIEPRFGIGYARISAILEDAMRKDDHHEWPAVVGDQIRRSHDVVWDTLCTLWVQNCLESAERQDFVDALVL